ncbi:MAG: hypothetical protein H0U49_12530, partial [Parachlamydiaceae bacterium]|nr:hypothetical protein [Parachlamydiaceae bacterium]
MQEYPTAYVQSEIHYHVQEQGLKHSTSAVTERILSLDPQLLFGESNLFNYDPINHTIVLSSPFKILLTLLVQLEALDSRALTAQSLFELKTILQQPQGIRGGLLRKAGTERWHLDDNPNMQKYNDIFDILFQHLGFVLPKSIDSEMTVDHCIIFGATTERMETRIIDTLEYLKT